MLDYPRAIGCDTNDRFPKFVPTEADVEEANALGFRDYILLHPTNAIATKRGIWPTEGWAALARALHERYDVPILLTGAHADEQINECDPPVSS